MKRFPKPALDSHLQMRALKLVERWQPGKVTQLGGADVGLHF